MKSLLILSLLVATSLSSLADESPQSNEKAERYYKLLLKRPDSGTLFERFVDSWLDTGSKEDLETYLQSGADNGGAQEWRLLATYQDWMGREEKALAAMSSALEKEPESGALFFARAKLKARLLDFEGALTDLEKSKNEAGEEAATLKGTWLARAGRPKDALAAWQELLAARPGDEELREDLIELQVGEGLYDEAIATARKLAEDSKDPYQKALRLMRMAGVEVMAGKQDEGLQSYRRVLEMTGEDSWLEKEVLAQVDKVFRREENIAGLRDFYAALREKFPQRVSLRKGLAAQMAANGEIDEAISLFREVLKITPGDLTNRQQFIALLESSERFDLAVEELEVTLRENNEQPEGWERMARLRDLMGDAKGLEEALDKVRELRSIDGPGIVATSSLYERYQMREKAEEILRKGHADFPEASEVTEALASFLADINATEENQAEATQMWRAMAEGSDAEGLLRVARALLANRRAEACFTLLTERITEFPENLLLLKQLCDAGLASDQAEQALPHALKMAELAESPTDLGSALAEVTRLSRRLDLEPVLADLMTQENKSAKQWCVVAELNELQGDLIASDRALAEAAQLEEGPLILSQKVRLLESRDELEKAATVMREIIALPGGERPVYLRKLVTLLATAGDWEAALAATDDWKRIAPGDKGAWLRRSELLNESGALEETVNELRRALAKFGDEEDIKGLLANALVEAGEYTEGERLYRKLYEEAADANAKNSWIERLAELAQQENRVEELLSEFERRKRRNSQEAGPLQALASIHEKLGDYEMQRESLAEAVRRKPKNVKLRHDLARVEEQAGDIDRAMSTLREAARLDSGPLSNQKLVEFYFRNGEIELGLDVLRGIQNGDPREVEKTTLALMQNGEWETAGNFLAENESSDWRLAFLNGLHLYKMDEKDAARIIIRQLTSITGEIEGLKPQIDEKMFQQWQKWAKQSGRQDDTREGILITIMGQYIHSLNQLGTQQSGYGYRHSRSAQQGQILPGTTEEMRALALSFLINDANQQSGEERDKLIASIQFPKGRLGKQLKNQHRLVEWVEEELTAGRMDLAEAVELTANNPEFDTKLLVQAATEFKESAPKAANIALTVLLNRDSDLSTNEIITQKLALLEKSDPDVRMAHLNYLASLVFAQPQNQYNYYDEQQPITIDKATKELLRKTLSAELAKFPIGAKPKDGEPALTDAPWVQALLNEAWQSGRAKDFIDLTNRLTQEYAVNVKARPGMIYYQGSYYPASAFRNRSNTKTLFQPPSFPRPQLDLPPAVQQMLSVPFASEATAQDQGNAFVKKWSKARDARLAEKTAEVVVEDKGMTPELLAPELARIQSSRLRILALHWAGLAKELEEELTAFESSQDANEVLSAAGYWFQKKDLTKSYQLLTKARFLPMEKDERKAVDGQLTLVGSMLSQQGTDLDQLEVAQRAVLRIRRSTRTADEEKAIAGPMTSLGLSDIVEQMQAARLRRGSSSNNNNRRSHNGTSPRLTKALSEGNKKAAAREALRLLRPLLRVQNNSYQLRQVVEKLQAGNITDEIIALANPGETKSYSRRIEFVSLCEAFNKGELATPVLRALSLERPDDTVITAKLARQLPREEMMAKARELMTPEAVTDFGTLILRLVNTASDDPFDNDSSPESQEKAESNLTAFTLCTEYFDTIEPIPDAGRNLSWYLAVLAGGALDDWDIEDKESPSFTEEAPKPSELHQKRVSVTRKLLQSALRHPQIASQTFSVMDGYRKGLQWTDEELFEAAFTASASSAKREKTSTDPRLSYMLNNPWGVFLGQHSSQQEPEHLGKTPNTYLTRALSQDEALSSGEFFARFRKVAPDECEKIELARIFANEPQEAADAALTEWRSQLDNKRKKKLAQYLSFLTVATYNDTPTERIDTLEREYLRILIKNMQHNEVTGPALSSLSQAHFEVGGTAALEAHLERLLSELIGSPELQEQWTELSRTNQLRGSQVNAIAYLIRKLGEELTSQCRDVDQLLAITRSRPFLHNNEYNISRSFKAILSSKSPKEADKALKKIRFWSRSWAELGQPLDLEGKKYAWNVILGAVGGSQTRTTLGDKLAKAEGGRRFRNRLAAATLDRNKLQIPDELEDVAGKMLAMAPEEQAGIANILRTQYPTLNIPNAQPNTAKLLTLLGKKDESDIIAAAREQMEKGFSGQIHDYQGRSKINSDTLKLLQSDAQLAAEYFAVAIKEPKVKRHNGFGRSMQTSVGNSTVTEQDQYFGDLLDDVDNSSSAITFLQWCRFQRLFETLPDAPLISIGHAQRYDFSGITSRFWNKQPKRKNLKGIEAKMFREQHWDDLPKNFEDEPIPIRKTAIWMLWIASSETWNVDNQARQHWDWMKKNNYAERHPICAARNRTLTALRAWEKLTPEAHQNARETWAEVLADPEMSVRFRMEVVCAGLAQEPRLADSPEVVAVITDLFEAYIAEKRTLTPAPITALLTGLGALTTPLPRDRWTPLIEECSRSVLMRAASRNGNVSNSDKKFAESLVKLSIKLENFEVTKSVLAISHESLRGNLDLMLALISKGQAPLAKQLTTTPGLLYLVPKNSKWTPEFAKTVAELLELVPNKQERFRVQCILASLPDAEEKEMEPNQLGRLTALAKEYSEKAPKVPQARLQTLKALMKKRDAHAILLPELETVTQRYLITQSVEQSRMPGDLSAENVSHILLSHFWNMARLENFAPMDRHMKALASAIATDRSSYYAERKAKDLHSIIFTGFLTGRMEAPEEPIAPELLEFTKDWYRAFSLLKCDNRYLKTRRVALPLLIHAMAGKSEEFHNWISTLPEKEQAAYHEQLKDPEKITTLWAKNQWQQKHKEKTIGPYFAKSLLADHFASNMLLSPHNASIQLVVYEVLTPKEYENIFLSVPNHPQASQFLMNVGVYLAYNDKKSLRKSQGLLTKALEQMIANKDPKEHICRASVAYFHGNKLKDYKTAIEVAKKIDWDKIPKEEAPRYRKLFNKHPGLLKKQLTQKKKKEQSKKPQAKEPSKEQPAKK